MTSMFDERTGEVFIRNFDQGIIETLGGYIDVPTDPDLIAQLGGAKRNYFIDMPTLEQPKVPVIFGNPEAIKERKIYPSFLFIRQDPTPALGRWHSVGQKEYRIPADDAVLEESMGVSGYSKYEEQAQSMPYDITYDIQIQARIESDAITMLKKVLSVYGPYCKIDLLDSLGEVRSYSAYQESVSDIGELIDVADRMKGHSVTIRIEGELTLSGAGTFATAKTFEQRGTVE